MRARPLPVWACHLLWWTSWRVHILLSLYIAWLRHVLQRTQISLYPAGGVSGAVAIVCGQPLDVVRIQQQTNPLAPGSTVAAFKSLVQRGGLQSLLKGAAFPIGSIAFQTALTFQAYGAASRYLAGPSQHNSIAQASISAFAAGSLEAALKSC